MQLKQFFESRFPDLIGSIHGAHYPSPPFAQTLASVVGMLQMLIFGFMIFGKKIFMGFEHPVLDFAEQNKFALVAGIFLLNSVTNSMVQTGAFEISYSGGREAGRLLYSKLETGHLPSTAELQGIVHQLKGFGLQMVRAPGISGTAGQHLH